MRYERPQTIEAATALLDGQPLYTDTQRALLSWAADYYQHPLGEVLPLGLSPRERRGQPERALTETGIRLTARGQGLPDGAPHRAPKQAALVSRLKLGPRPVTELKAEGFSSAAPVSSKRVQRKGNIKHEHQRNLGPIRPKTLLGQVGHPGPSANLLPDLLPDLERQAPIISGSRHPLLARSCRPPSNNWGHLLGCLWMYCASCSANAGL